MRKIKLTIIVLLSLIVLPALTTGALANEGSNASSVRARSITNSSPGVSSSSSQQILQAPTLGDGLLGQYWNSLFFGTNLCCSFPVTPATPPDQTVIDPQINFATSTAYGWHPFGYGTFSVRWTGTLNIAFSGTYSFQLNSDDGSWLLIDSTLVINNGGAHGPSIVGASTFLAQGAHKIEVDFFECCGGASGVDLYWMPPGAPSFAIVPAEVFNPPQSSFVGRVCIVPGDSTACPQTVPRVIADPAGHLDISINILGSRSFNASAVYLRWDPTIMNATGVDLTNTILPSPTVSARCINNIGFGCNAHDGVGIAHLDLVGANTAAPSTGRLFKISLVGSAGVDPHIGFATGCSTVSIGALLAQGSVPNTDLCLLLGVITTTICTTLCTQALTSDPVGIQSQSLGVHLPTPLATGTFPGNITGTLSAGGAPNFADTWIMPYPVTLPGNVTAWKAQFTNGVISSTIPVPPTPVGVQIKVLRKTSANIFTVVEVGPIHDPRPVLASRLASWPNVLTEETVIPYYTDTLLTVLPGDFIGLTLMSNSTLGVYEYPEVTSTVGTRFVTSNVTLGGTIDLSATFTGRLPGFAPAIDVTIQPSPAKLDSPGDGIPDFVALSPEMQALGVDPCRKTVLVQLDYMVPAQGSLTFKPLQQALDTVTGAFDSAPVPAVSNCPYQGFPRKPSGIKLVLDVQNAIPEQDTFSFTHSEPLSFDIVKAVHFDPNRVHYFHYGIFINQTASGDTTSGVGETFGSNFMVSLGNWTNKVGSVSEQAGTLMHELGHNLGLNHGGKDSVNFKPNYLSVMSYEHQVVGITTRTPTGDVTRFDYSREEMPTLNESNLSEWATLSNSNDYTKWVCPDHHTVKRDVVSNSLDWNCDGILSTGVVDDLNNDTVTGMLTGYNDWPNLRFKFTESVNFNVGCRVSCDIGCRVSCDIGCRVSCDIGCRVGCDIGCRVGCDFGIELDRKTAVAIEASWTAFFASPHRSTSTSINCSPSSVTVTLSSSCMATVTDDAAGTPMPLTGTVSFQSSQPGSFTPATCSLTGTGATGTCSVNYSPGITSLGPQTITAGYAGDLNHLGSSGTTTITGLPLPPIVTITSDTKLTADVTARIVIGADGITLNCNGHTISGITTAPATPLQNNGITINGRKGVFVLNCNVKNFYIGIQLTSSNGTFISGNNVTGNGYGFFLSSSNSNHLATNNASRNGLDGFRLVSSNSNGLAGNTANGNSGSGFSLLSSNFNGLTGNTASRNGLDGFLSVSSAGNSLLSDTANGNGSYGFALTLGSNNNLVQSNSACTNGLFDAFQDTTSTGNVYKSNKFCTTKGLPSKF